MPSLHRIPITGHQPCTAAVRPLAAHICVTLYDDRFGRLICDRKASSTWQVLTATEHGGGKTVPTQTGLAGPDPQTGRDADHQRHTVFD